MSGLSVKASFNVDVVQLLKLVIDNVPEKVSFQENSTIDGGNGRWISCQTNGRVVSAFYHKTKPHSATVKSGFNQAKSAAQPGEWAVAYINSSLFTDKTFYDYW